MPWVRQAFTSVYKPFPRRYAHGTTCRRELQRVQTEPGRPKVREKYLFTLSGYFILYDKRKLYVQVSNSEMEADIEYFL